MSLCAVLHIIHTFHETYPYPIYSRALGARYGEL